MDYESFHAEVVGLEGVMDAPQGISIFESMSFYFTLMQLTS